MSLTTSGSDAVILNRARELVCLEAAWEIEVLAQMLPGLVPEDEHKGHYAVRGLAARMRDLSRAIMSGLSDEVESTSALENRVMCNRSDR